MLKLLLLRSCSAFGLSRWNWLVFSMEFWGYFVILSLSKTVSPTRARALSVSRASVPQFWEKHLANSRDSADLLTRWLIIASINWMLIMYLAMTYVALFFFFCMTWTETKRGMGTQLHVVVTSWAGTQDFCLSSLQWAVGSIKTFLPPHILLTWHQSPCMLGSGR